MGKTDEPRYGAGFTLVLGGGGVVGIAWTIGIMLGLADRQVRLDAADRVIGTSAGSVAGAQLLSGVPLDALFECQVDPARQVAERVPDATSLARASVYMPLLREVRGAGAREALVARFLDEPSFLGEARRKAIIAARLPSHHWPDAPLLISAVDLETGELDMFDRDCGARLVDVVAASCAVPGVWPPVAVQGKRYVDGGVRSAENADLARGARTVVILAPNGSHPEDPGGGLPGQVDALEALGVKVVVIEPDGQARAAMGVNALDPAARAPAAQAGRAQGRREAERVRPFVTEI